MRHMITFDTHPDRYRYWKLSVRLGLEERASYSPEALTGTYGSGARGQFDKRRV